MNGRALLEETIEALGAVRVALVDLPGVDIVDERIVGRPGVWDYDPLRLVVDVSRTPHSGFELATHMRERSGVFLEFVEEDVLVALFGLGGSAQDDGARLVSGLRLALAELGPAPGEGPKQRWSPNSAPARWGKLEMAPREAFLAAHEAVPIEEAIGRVAAEALAVYPPGIANVLPGERLTAATLRYVRRTSEQGGRIRGASDPTLRTVQVVYDP